MTIFWCLHERAEARGQRAQGKRVERSDALRERELAQINVILGRGDEVDELADLSLECGVVERLEDMDVVRF